MERKNFHLANEGIIEGHEVLSVYEKMGKVCRVCAEREKMIANTCIKRVMGFCRHYWIIC